MDPVALLRQTPHNFHRAANGEPWGLDGALLDFLSANVPSGGATLETGAGESTIVFLARSSQHIAIAPVADERDAIVAFCSEHGIPLDGLAFQLGCSDRILPNLSLPPLDVVLIDGQHAFPAPFLDWYYTADQVRKGGRVVIDDVPIRTGAILKDFLNAEPEWRMCNDFGRAVVFEKLVDGAVTGKWWLQQPWCEAHWDAPQSSLIASVRGTLRLRSRARAAFHR